MGPDHPSRRRDDLAAALTRELQAPVAALTALAALLEQQAHAPDTAACVRSLAREAARLREVLADAEALSGAAPGAPAAVVALADLAEELCAAGVQAVYEGERDAALHVQEDALRQALRAVIRHVQGPGAPVEAALSATRQGAELLVSLRVSGAGDPAGDEPLGVLLARRRLAAWSGALSFERNPGAGVTARLHFRAPAAIVTAPGPDAPAEEGRGLHVLIVDDNATNRLVAEAFCEMFGCTSEAAEDGLEALEAVRLRAFDVILMDVKMPRMDGVEATRAVRSLAGPERATPIIALTANADPEDVRRYYAAGMQDVIEKPIKADRLASALNAVASGELHARAA